VGPYVFNFTPFYSHFGFSGEERCHVQCKAWFWQLQFAPLCSCGTTSVRTVVFLWHNFSSHRCVPVAQLQFAPLCSCGTTSGSLRLVERDALCSCSCVSAPDNAKKKSVNKPTRKPHMLSLYTLPHTAMCTNDITFYSGMHCLSFVMLNTLLQYKRLSLQILVELPAEAVC